LVTIDPATGTVTAVGATEASLDAIALRPRLIPEPSTLGLMLGAAIVGMLSRSRESKR
jgi:hypothetical protein